MREVGMALAILALLIVGIVFYQQITASLSWRLILGTLCLCLAAGYSTAVWRQYRRGR